MSSRVGHIASLIKTAATLGPAWALRRCKFTLAKRLGVLRRRTPLYNWSDLGLEQVLRPGIPTEPVSYSGWRRVQPTSFFLATLSTENGRDFVGGGSVLLADKVLEGEYPFFGYSRHLGCSVAWQGQPRNTSTSHSRHWSDIDEFESGDIKLSWEPNRFTWAYALARAYIRTKHEPYAAAFWHLFESWLVENPPNSGLNWKCGQEASFRVMALCFGLSAFGASPASTPERLAAFVAAIGVHAKRINAYIEYAISQKNNHGISEGVGLWTISLLFPELKGASEWKMRGKQVIESETRRQIYSDGSYVQHSINYHRVMLHDLAWALRLGELDADPLSRDVYERFRKSIHFLAAVTDPVSGRAPNYGANDGALILPLSDCDYPNMRPVLQSCYFLAEGERLYPPGPWDEEMVWLHGPQALTAKQVLRNPSRRDLNATAGGYYTLHSSHSWILFRAARFEDRPSHADQLHVDMWWQGENVLCDPGTYSYNSPAPFDDGFAGTRYHNCVTVNGADQMTRLGRFLWGDWANARMHRTQESSEEIRVLEGEHDGYAKFGVKHRRAIACINADKWIIIDDLVGTGERSCRLHWLAPDVPFENSGHGVLDLRFNCGTMRLVLASSAVADVDVVRAGEWVVGNRREPPDAARGWQSRLYARKEPALSIALQSRSAMPVRFITVVMLDMQSDVTVSTTLRDVCIGSLQIELSEVGKFPIHLSRT